MAHMSNPLVEAFGHAPGKGFDAHFDPSQHPRDAMGKFSRVLGRLSDEQKVGLPGGVVVTKKGGTPANQGFHVKGPNGGRFVRTASEASAEAMNAYHSADSKAVSRPQGSTVAGRNASGGLTVIAQTSHKDIADKPLSAEDFNKLMHKELGYDPSKPVSKAEKARRKQAEQRRAKDIEIGKKALPKKKDGQGNSTLPGHNSGYSLDGEVSLGRTSGASTEVKIGDTPIGTVKKSGSYWVGALNGQHYRGFTATTKKAAAEKLAQRARDFEKALPKGAAAPSAAKGTKLVSPTAAELSRQIDGLKKDSQYFEVGGVRVTKNGTGWSLHSVGGDGPARYITTSYDKQTIIKRILDDKLAEAFNINWNEADHPRGPLGIFIEKLKDIDAKPVPRSPDPTAIHKAWNRRIGSPMHKDLIERVGKLGPGKSLVSGNYHYGWDAQSGDIVVSVQRNGQSRTLGRYASAEQAVTDAFEHRAGTGKHAQRRKVARTMAKHGRHRNPLTVGFA